MSVHIPKPLIVGVAYLMACAIGWILYASMTGGASAEAPNLSGALTSTPVAAAAVPVAGPLDATGSDAPVAAVAVPAAVVDAAVAPASSRALPAVVQPTLAPPQNSTYVTTPGDTVALTDATDTTDPASLDEATKVAPVGSDVSTQAAPADPSYGDQLPSLTMQAQPYAESTGTGSTVSIVIAPPSVSASDGPSTAVDSSALGSGLAQTAAVVSALDSSDAAEVGPNWMRGPASYIAPILGPLPGAQTRGVAFAEWESYRTDVAGRNIIATTDDSNVFVSRDGKLNGNTGDTDASGLNVTDARNSVIRGTESADFPPWGDSGPDSDDDADDEGEDEEDSDSDTDTGDSDSDTDTGDELTAERASAEPVPSAFAAVITPVTSDDDDSESDDFDFPYTEWVRQISGDRASAIHTDEGTTLASGQDAIAIGADGYDDDDNRAVGENIVLTRDDCNVVIGGSGPVNGQIGDSEQGAVIMDVDSVVIEGGGAY